MEMVEKDLRSQRLREKMKNSYVVNNSGNKSE